MEKIIHQIWIGPHQIPEREYNFVEEIIKKETEFEHKFWTNDNLPTLPPAIGQIYKVFGERKDYAFQADILKIYLIYKYGGMFMDVDFQMKKGFKGINFNCNGIFFHHDVMDFTIPNNVFGGKAGNRIYKYLADQIGSHYGWYGPSWLGEKVKAYFNLDYCVKHDDLGNQLLLEDFQYLSYQDLEKNHYLHTSLYSWSPENRKKFEEGGFKW